MVTPRRVHPSGLTGRSVPLPVQPLQQLDLPGVVHVMRGDATDDGRVAQLAAAGDPLQVPWRHPGDDGSQFPMCVLE